MISRTDIALPAIALASAILVSANSVSAQDPAPIDPARAAPEGTYGDLDVLHYDLEIGLPPPGGTTIDGRARIRFKPARSGVTRAVFDLTGLVLDTVTLDGAIATADYADGRLSVSLPRQSTPDDTFDLEIAYHGTPDDGLMFGNNLHDRPVIFADNWPNRARFWFPAVDHPSDKATATITVHALADWDVVANGALSGEPVAGPPAADGSPRRTWAWSIAEPVATYNFVIGAADMTVVPLGTAACGAAPNSPRADGCVEVAAWLYEEDVAQARLSFRRAPEMLDYYTALVGPYAFEKLAHVQAASVFGGMENASAIFYHARGLADGVNLEDTVAHETAHQWFGAVVTPSDWSELWLSEGFATYFGALFFEHADGPEPFRGRMADAREAFLSSGDEDRPVIGLPSPELFDLIDANNYMKGAWVLHMLRGLVGDDAFFKGIRIYYERHAGRNAATDDFRRAMEEAAARDLAWFFDQWLRRPGYPVLDVEWTWDAAASEAIVSVTQAQSRSWPVFRLPLAIRIETASGASELHSIELLGRAERFRIAVDVEPRSVTLDPDGWILKGEGRVRRVRRLE
jgi:aminopeptidase N